jgi:hypothetical protein
MLVPQDRQRAGRAPEERASGGQEGADGDLECPRTAATPTTPPPRSWPPTGRNPPKAATKITDDLDELLAFYDRPSTGSTCEPRTRSSPPSPRPTPHQDHPWAGIPGGRAGHRVQADRGRPGPLAGGQRADLVALARSGATFEAGKLVERPDDTPSTPQPEAA